MKTMVHILFKPALLFILTAFMLGTNAHAQNHTDKRSVSKRYAASRETTLEVQNKYGKIQVETWSKDSIALEVEIFLTESSPSKLRKLKDDIRINFTGTKTYIIAKTVIVSESGRIAREIKSITNTITGTNKQVEINYMVYVPEYMDVVLQNKFGDIYMDDLSGHVDIELSNGVLKANRLEGNSSIDLSFADGMINQLGSTTMKLSYSDLVLGEVNQLDLNSKSSQLNVDKVNVLKINSRRDKLYFKQAEYFYGKSTFTQVWIYDFIRECDVIMKYGKLTIESVLPAFNKIFVESDYTDITLYLDQESQVAFDILHHEKVVLRLPGERGEVEETFDGKHHYQTTGTLGGPESVSSLKIDALQKCYINISFK